MKTFLYLLLGAGLLLALGACSDDSSSPASETITGPSGEEVALNGTWKPPDGCLELGSESEATVVTVSGTGLSVNYDSYWEVGDCSGTAEITVATSGSFALGEEVTATLGGSDVTASQADFTWTSATATPNTAEAAAQMNSSEECGVSDWAEGVASDVLGTSDCQPVTEMQLLYVDDEATPNRLHLGDPESAGSDGYPTELPSDYLERQ